MRIQFLFPNVFAFVAASALQAQVTGTLGSQSTQGIVASSATSASPFASLVYDPSLSRIDRTSNWTVNVVAAQTAKEATVQLNLCDIPAVSDKCGPNHGLRLAFAGPIDKSGFTELADLNGLAGQTRVELGAALNVGNQGLTVGAEGVYARPHFDYQDQSTLADASVNRSAGSVAGSIGWKSQIASLNVGVRWEKSQRERASESVCSPAGFGPANTQVCRDLIVGAPREKTTSVASFDFGYSVGVGALHVVASRDLRANITGVDIPVYVLSNGTGGLAGGVRGGYRSDTHRFTIALFVGEFKL